MLLKLPDEERGALAALLLRSLEPDDGDEPTGKLRALRAELKLGVDALRRGDAVVVDEADLDGYLTSLAARRGKRTRAR